ncbi:MAG: YraN family protein [Opitutales bacterium]|nr:YraN family protein [Opitutales bacterium]
MESADSQALGNMGEAAALGYLGEKGFRLLARNWRHGRGEIDLILRDESTLIFVEVRARRSGAKVPPYESIRQHKWRVLRRTALAYYRRLYWRPKTLRFDVVAVQHEAGMIKDIRHYENVGLFGRYV